MTAVERGLGGGEEERRFWKKSKFWSHFRALLLSRWHQYELRLYSPYCPSSVMPAPLSLWPWLRTSFFLSEVEGNGSTCLIGWQSLGLSESIPGTMWAFKVLALFTIMCSDPGRAREAPPRRSGWGAPRLPAVLIPAHPPGRGTVTTTPTRWDPFEFQANSVLNLWRVLTWMV